MMCQLKNLKIKRATLVLFLLSGLAILLPTSALADQSVTFGWEPSNDPNVVGYNIYYGTVSQVYTNKVSVGNMTVATISELVEGTTYYFAATTYDVLNQESIFSDEISYTVPVADTHQPPVITETPTTNTAIVGQNMIFGITATGTGLLSYSLGSGAPVGASINPTTGLFVWNPKNFQASTTNVIPVIVTDNGNPPMSTTQTFTIVVRDYIHLSLGSTMVATSSNGGLVLMVYASTPITNLQFTLNYSPDILTNLFFLNTDPLAGMASITPIGSGQALVAVGASAGQSIIGLQTIGVIGFNAVADNKTEFTYVKTDKPLAWKTDGILANYSEAAQARVTIVGQEAMVEAQLADKVRSLIVYGPMGASYQIESCNALATSGAWTETMMPFTMTNLSRTIQLPLDTNCATFYRTRRIQ